MLPLDNPARLAIHRFFIAFILLQAGPGEHLNQLLGTTTAAFPGAGKAWQKAQTYYLRSIARLQRLWQVGTQPCDAHHFPPKPHCHIQITYILVV